jgi:hypothetical protein
VALGGIVNIPKLLRYTGFYRSLWKGAQEVTVVMRNIFFDIIAEDDYPANFTETDKMQFGIAFSMAPAYANK